MGQRIQNWVYEGKATEQRVGRESVQFDLVVITGLGEVFWKQNSRSRIQYRNKANDFMES